MKLERCIQGTPEEMEAARVALDKLLGYPKRGVHVGGGIHCDMPDEWDGTGPTPPGWTKSYSAPVLTTDSKLAYLAVTGVEMDMADPEKLAKVGAGERALLGRVTQSELVDVKAIVAATEATAEPEPMALETKLLIGATVLAAAAEVIRFFV